MEPEWLDDLKRRRRNVRAEELHTILLRAGFERRYGKGDHWVYSHPKLDYRLTIDPARRLLPVYVSRAIRALEEVLDDEPED